MTLLDDRAGSQVAPETHLLIREARRRQRRRWLLGVSAAVLVAALIPLGVVLGFQGGGDRISGRGNRASDLRSILVSTDRGVATGLAVPCSGPMYEPKAHLRIYHGPHQVAQKFVSTGTTFRFVLPSGHYVISNDGDPTRSGYPPGDSFQVSAGVTTHVVVVNYCM